MDIDHKTLNPALHPKYSPNFYKWLNSERIRKHHCRLEAFDWNGSVYIGFEFDKDLIGASLNMVLLSPSETLKSYSSFDGVRYNGVLIPDFWEKYQEGGRCYFDPAHYKLFLDERWKTEDDTRECLWCGHKQTLKRWSETVEKTKWVDNLD